MNILDRSSIMNAIYGTFYRRLLSIKESRGEINLPGARIYEHAIKTSREYNKYLPFGRRRKGAEASNKNTDTV